ncbi:hypothetical protein P9F83_13060 [Peribacillus psychrosaccharolyticus]|uniref:hypothetical protein n=1 Tax=Peribacillus psychrosaccharolyticus TaxID=1407 RepID=UPI0012690E7B|nr:hypothetical protein [Peribacillus psychrosaccharolyticus]MEC2056152.1 hypothetical protein [Peribacillus psychrosaccharolyticus]MED3745592.1 hypothetical protein [Peribacillus psychrosaccharolyticus]
MSSNDIAACAFRDSLPDSSEKRATFLGTQPPNGEVHFPVRVSAHVSSLLQVVFFFGCSSLCPGLPYRLQGVFYSTKQSTVDSLTRSEEPFQ